MKMKKYLALLVAIATIFALACCSQSAKSGEKNDPAAVTITVHLLTEDALKSECTNYEYNDKGDLTKKITFSVTADGEKAERSRQEYTYDNNGNLVRVDNYTYGTADSYTTYTYDDQGMLVRSAVYAQDAETSHTDYTYDSNGNKTLQVYYSYGMETERYEYLYNAEGTLIQETYYLEELKVTCSTYEYDFTTNQMLKSTCGTYGALLSRETFNHDENDCLTTSSLAISGRANKIHNYKYITMTLSLEKAQKLAKQHKDTYGMIVIGE